MNRQLGDILGELRDLLPDDVEHNGHTDVEGEFDCGACVIATLRRVYDRHREVYVTSVVADVTEAVNARFDDGTPVLTYVFAKYPDLARRLRVALSGDQS